MVDKKKSQLKIFEKAAHHLRAGNLEAPQAASAAKTGARSRRKCRVNPLVQLSQQT